MYSVAVHSTQYIVHSTYSPRDKTKGEYSINILSLYEASDVNKENSQA